ncbi:MAG: ATP-binding cassette domain-containing protein [Proteobacteria bacterium]|nr:ATP-binding cassette domain-containing protein [Pseudomonadota bacterium]
MNTSVTPPHASSAEQVDLSAGPAIELEHVGLAFGKTVVHRDISLAIGVGEGVTLLGPSGTGKTLILKLICGLLQPTQGVVRIFGNTLTGLDEDALARVRANIGMLFQGAALFDSLTVFENISYPLYEAGERNQEVLRAEVARLLSVIALPGIEEKYPPELSGGQKKRVALARALARRPRILLFDEPTTGLDPTATRLIDDLIVQLRSDLQVTTVAVTHDIESARRISHRWVLLNKGRVVADGPVEEVSRGNEYVTRFISGRWAEGG